MKDQRTLQSVLVTGGAGFIGSNFIRYLFARPDFTGRIINLDKLTYAGNPKSLTDIEQSYGPNRYLLSRTDICDTESVTTLMKREHVDSIVHLAAESHVDRSILGPKEFIQTNVVGTFSLLEAARAAWAGADGVIFHHVSTDEVFGSLGQEGYFREETPYDPRSPYSASKASSDHLVRAYHHTYGLPVTISNCSNNYGPYQFPEKLIPLMILNMLEGKPLPVYGKGENVRDWLYVEDHAAAIWSILKSAAPGATYTVGGENEWKNIDLVHALCGIVAEQTGTPVDQYLRLIRFVTDRPGHDQRYAIDCSKIKQELSWSRGMSFEAGLSATVSWYLANLEWIDSVRSGEYRSWIDANYAGRSH